MPQCLILTLSPFTAMSETSSIPASLISDILNTVATSDDKSYGSVESITKSAVSSYNAANPGSVVEEGVVIVEVAHLLNSLKTNPHPPRIDTKSEYCACGNAYKTEEELQKHKPKCWLLVANTRTQRACRSKAPTDYAGEEEEEEPPKRKKCDEGDEDYDKSGAPQQPPIKDRTCGLCGFVSRSIRGIQCHMSRCNQKRETAQLVQRSCQLCERRFLLTEELSLHYTVEHGVTVTDRGEQRELKCEKCSEEFPLVGGMDSHVCGSRKVRIDFQRCKAMIGSGIVRRPPVERFYCPRCCVRVGCFEEMAGHCQQQTVT